MKITGKYIEVFDNERQCVIREHVKVWLDANGLSNIKRMSDYKDGSYVIHHINGNRSDNRIENLMCVTKSEHARIHAKLREPEYYKKISDSLKGRPKSIETRRKMSIAQRNRDNSKRIYKSLSEETKLKISKSNKNTWHNKSEEEMTGFKNKISNSRKGKVAWNKNIPCTTEQKTKISNSLSKKYRDGYIPPSTGRIYVTNGEVNHQIYPEELEKYEKLGYHKGLTRRNKKNGV